MDQRVQAFLPTEESSAATTSAAQLNHNIQITDHPAKYWPLNDQREQVSLPANNQVTDHPTKYWPLNDQGGQAFLPSHESVCQPTHRILPQHRILLQHK